MPVDHVDARLIHHDGERSEVIFLLPPGEELAKAVTEGDGFLPVMRNAKICIVARDAIAVVGIPLRPMQPDMPIETQRVAVKLRSGMMLEGELRWTSVSGKQRAADCLNNEARYIEVCTADTSFFIVKAHVAYVQEM